MINGSPLLKVNESLPMLGREDDPSKVVWLRKLTVGDRVHHRAYGFGSIESLERDENGTGLSINFDEEGRHSFHFHHQRALNPESLVTRWIRSLIRKF